jgi:hypothetical protein
VNLAFAGFGLVFVVPVFFEAGRLRGAVALWL